MNEEEQLAILCRRFGAKPPQDMVMSRMLLKRARQISVSREIEVTEALQYLLSLLIKAKEKGTTAHSAPQEGWEGVPFPKKFDEDQENR